METTDQAPQLLITFNYDQRLLDGHRPFPSATRKSDGAIRKSTT
jgi:hypothetical protein